MKRTASKFFLISAVILAASVFFLFNREPSFNFEAGLKDSYQAAEQWFLANQKDNGLFYYIYNPKNGDLPNSNNAIRQLMASRLLAEMAVGDESLLHMHENNLDFVMKYWYKEKEDLAYVYLYDKSKLGANAMLLRTLVYSPFYEDYADEAKKLADGILSLMNDDGSFEPWFIEPDYEYNKDYLLTFYSGEALLSLLEYYEKSGNETYLNYAKKSQDFYIVRYVENIKDNYYPAYVPWHTLSLYKLYRITDDGKYVRAVFILNDKLLEIQDTKEFIGRFYDPGHPEFGTPHSASDGVFTEGLAYANELATLAGDRSRANKYHKALERAVENLISLQYLEEDPRYSEHWRYLGAFRYKVGDPRIRIDTTQHTLDAYRKILAFM